MFNLEYFIARRTARAAKSQEPSVMMRVATVAVALGIVVMIITIAVIGGFKSQINSKLSALSGHIVVTNVRGVDSGLAISDSDALQRIIDRVKPTRKSEYILRGAIARGGGIIEGVVVKGVDPNFNAPFFGEKLIEGELPRYGEPEARREVLISEELARDMSIEAGERLELLFVDNDGEVDRLIFKVGGVFSAGIGVMERGVVIADIETLRKVNEWESGQISGCEVWIDDIHSATTKSSHINTMVFDSDSPELESVGAISIERLYPSLFDWLKTHNVNGVIVVSIMLIVALFNMVTALLILVLERTRMVGILKALGMSNNSLSKIFLYRALDITLRGLAWGNAIALVLCGAQQHWGILKLDSAGYMLSVVPIELGVWWIVALNVGVVGVILLVMTIPTRIVATITPDEIVKYK